MLLSVSNIAWHKGDDHEFFDLLKEFGFRGIDVAPTKIWPDWKVTGDSAQILRERLTASGLSAVGMQSIFFGTEGLNLFAQPEQWLATKRHLRRVALIAQWIGATRVVFGAPNNRDPNGVPESAVREIAKRRLRKLGAIFSERGAVLCLEPVPIVAGGRFLCTTMEAADFVRDVSHPGIGLNLDAAFLAGEEVPIEQAVRDCADVIAHVHASEPGLGNFAEPKVDHGIIGWALKNIGYSGAVAIEMRAVDGLEDKNLRLAMTVVRQCYGQD